MDSPAAANRSRSSVPPPIDSESCSAARAESHKPIGSIPLGETRSRTGTNTRSTCSHVSLIVRPATTLVQYAGSTGNQGRLLDEPEEPEDEPDEDFAPAAPEAPVTPNGLLGSLNTISVRVTVVLRRPSRTSTVVSTVTTLLLDTPFLVTECVSVDVEVVVDDPVSSVGSSVTSTVFLGGTADVAAGAAFVVAG